MNINIGDNYGENSEVVFVGLLDAGCGRDAKQFIARPNKVRVEYEKQGRRLTDEAGLRLLVERGFCLVRMIENGLSVIVAMGYYSQGEKLTLLK